MNAKDKMQSVNNERRQGASRKLLRTAARVGLFAAVGVMGTAAGCLDRPVGKLAPETTSLIVDKIAQDRVDKIDLLFMVDNSVSMADKQVILQDAVPDLVGRLVNPVCVETATGMQNQGVTPADPEVECPEGYGREFEPILDINIAVITSSLGGFGATSNACKNDVTTSDQKEDMAHLVGSLPRGQAALAGATTADVGGLGFLEWRGAGRDDLETAFQGLVSAAGEFGCGYEASLEAWYRFLVDPEPYLELTPVSCSAGGTDTNCRAPSGIDQAVLAQRAAFLRPDSLVAVVMLTDENDCSVKASGQAWYVAEIGAMAPMWRASSVCATDPNNACCYSCGQAPPSGCEADAVCGSPTDTREPGDYYLDADQRKSTTDDPDNLRCFHQKQRFGVDFLYPISRYSNALYQREICVTRNDLAPENCGSGRLVDNPLYTIPEGSTVKLSRDPSLVFLAGIVGVPWQDIAVDPNDANELRYQTFADMLAQNTWDVILGDGVNPGDPLMAESRTPRTGTSPIVNAPLVGTGGDTLENPINGHEWQPTEDLQYACIFPLSQERDCAALQAANDPRNCDCLGAQPTAEGQSFKPLCQDPGGAYGNTQYYAKAYPGVRELQVLQSYGELTGNSIVASICARNVADTASQDYGYRPAIGALVDRLKEQLQDRCLPRPLALDSEGNVPCSIVEARAGDPASCGCDASAARGPVNEAALPLLYQKMEQNGMCKGAECQTNFCLCEVLPARKSGLAADSTEVNLQAEADCQNNETVASSTNGWCYVDATDAENPIGSPALVDKCPSTAKRKLRFVGDGRLDRGTVTFVACLGANLESTTISGGGAADASTP